MSILDKLIVEFDRGLKTAFSENASSNRPSPGSLLVEPMLRPHEKIEAMRLMRINHAGEIAAQALYQGQAMTAKLPEVRDEMEHAAEEEVDHLAWCAERVEELGGQTSVLQPLWHMGSFTIGALAGLAGDKWSLGFVGETERQVVEHLEKHQGQLPVNDKKSHAIIAQMKQDEAEHGAKAMEAGGAELPPPIKQAMKLSSKVMTKLAYWI